MNPLFKTSLATLKTLILTILALPFVEEPLVSDFMQFCSNRNFALNVLDKIFQTNTYLLNFLPFLGQHHSFSSTLISPSSTLGRQLNQHNVCFRKSTYMSYMPCLNKCCFFVFPGHPPNWLSFPWKLYILASLKLKSNALQIATRTHARVRTDRPPCETTLRFGGERGHARSSYSYHFFEIHLQPDSLILSTVFPW